MQTLWNLSCLLRIFDCMDVSISLNLLVFLSFPTTSVAFLGTFHANPVAPRWAIAIESAIANGVGNFSLHSWVLFLLHHPPSIYIALTTL